MGYTWLNVAGKLVLIKFVLSSLPIFQFSVILDPSCILRKMEALIRKFFWKGGNQNENRIPLVSWGKVSKPMLEGGLNFKDLSLQNMAMGANITWKLIAPHPGWAHRELWKKYFNGKRKHYLDSPISSYGSHFLKLCSKSIPLIKYHTFWIPGNGKQIKLWDDCIMKNPPLAETVSLQAL